MAVRGFFSRHRILAGAVAPAALGVAALVAVAVAVDSPQSRTIDTELTASVTECHDMVSIAVAGRHDTPDPNTVLMLEGADGKLLPAAMSGDYKSDRVDQVINPAGSVNTTKPGSYAAMYIAYPANMATYEDAVAAGAANTQSVMSAISAACPNTQFSIVGYSEGADVVRRVAMDIGTQKDNEFGVSADKVVGVVLLADAGRQEGDGTFLGAKDPFTNPDNFDKKYQNGTSAIPGQGALPDTAGGFGKLNGKVASFCSDGDFTCSAPENISLLILAANVGRQLNVDQLESQGLTPTTGQDVAVVFSGIMFKAFNDISSQPDWMQSDETFMDVLLKVSTPGYKPGTTDTVTPVAEDGTISAEKVSPLAYLPQKLFKEIVGLIATNQNTIPVIMSDPYQMTLAPGVGHHFDYWTDADAANGKPLTSAQYSAAWLTYLAQQAQEGKPVDTTVKPTPEQLAAAVDLYMANGGGEAGATDGNGTTTDTTSGSGQAPSGTTGSTESSGAAATPSQAPAAGSASATSSAVASPTGSVAPTSSAAVTSAPTSQAAQSDAAVTPTTTTTTTTTGATTTTKAPAN
ncbi:cutinase family protein [Rhodococcus sp. ARC_M6]|uniref:cutinase family protein n=1 Tax=Rhodococcus sp. ARC_M6 TaxID=2928852 RepID=UPI001FB45CEC|nr:cutinase family protein [Rhodococcus sp. ARC_M6]MCJ0905749.1 cutinase family protein [Rhodococcus sp. ARC_M6]